MFKKIKGIILYGLMLLVAGSGLTGFTNNQWRISINIPEYRLYLYNGDNLYQSYFIAVGRPDKPSPIGNFWVANKTVNPTWYPTDGRPPVPPGPNNPLGKYWLGLNIDGYGIHGNSAEWSIGNPVSKGCFRMHNSDVVKVFQLAPVGTPVQISYRTVRGSIDLSNQAWLEVFPDIYKRTNQTEAAFKALKELQWDLRPHLKILQELLKLPKPIKIAVPREIYVKGDLGEIDGFFWDQTVYLSRSVLGLLDLKSAGPDNGGSFTEYLSQSSLLGIADGQARLNWDPDLNVLTINRFKVELNGRSMLGVGRQDGNRECLVDLVRIAQALQNDLNWDQASVNAICHGVAVQGGVKEGGFWVSLVTLRMIWPEIRAEWDEETWTLRLSLDL